MQRNQRKLTQEQLQEELLQIESAKKDPKHFNVLYDKYYHPIFVFIHRRTYDESLSGDLCSQVFMKAMLNIKKYEYRGLPFSAWLYRIASNEVSEHYRKSSRHRVVTLETHHVSGMMEEISFEDQDWQYKLLKELLKELKPHEMQLLELRYFEKRPFREVGDILGITENNAKIKVHRVIGKLKKIMATKIKKVS